MRESSPRRYVVRRDARDGDEGIHGHALCVRDTTQSTPLLTIMPHGFDREQSLKTYRELSMSPNLLAFNMFASEMRLVLRDTSLLSRAEMQMGIEKVIGNRWKAMTPEEKEKHIDKARVEQARLIAEGGVPSTSGAARSKKQKAESAVSDASAPKRRRGRPPKTNAAPSKAASFAAHSAMQSHSHLQPWMEEDHTHDRDFSLGFNDHNLHSMSDLFLPFNNNSLPVVVSNQFDNKHHHQSHHDVHSFLQHDVVNVMDQDGLKPTQPPGNADLTGMKVEGFIDGTFDTGYFMTVRVNGQTLRGMLYREDACMRTIGNHAAQHTKI
jgi:hypothetical protein